MKLIRLICIIIICVSLNGCAIWLADDDVQREVYYSTHYRPYHPAPHRPAPKHKCHPDVHQKPDAHQTHRPGGKPNQKPTVKPNQKPNNGNNPRPNGSSSSSPNRPRTKK